MRIRNSLGVEVAAVLEGHETPYYLVDRDVFRSRIEQLGAALPIGSLIYYSAKANPAPALLAAAADAGCGVEVASRGELRRALDASAPAESLVLVGPGKKDDLLRLATSAGVGAIIVESLTELARLERVAEHEGTKVDVAVRLDVAGAKGKLRMAGHQFGCDLQQAEDCVKFVESSPWLRFLGYHSYLASQLLQADQIVHNCTITVERIEELIRRTGVEPEFVDLGGGFGIPYSWSDEDLDLGALADGLTAVSSRLPGSTRLAFESGRYICGPAGALVLRVMDIKSVEGARFAIADGGINVSGILGGTGAVRAPRVSAFRGGRLVGEGEPIHICGPLCTPMDRLASGIRMDLEPGDLLVWWNHGAYGRSAAPVDFLSFDPPDECFFEYTPGAEARIVKRLPGADNHRGYARWSSRMYQGHAARTTALTHEPAGKSRLLALEATG